MREIEIKIKTDDLKAVEEKLAGLGCEISEPIRQEDVIYSYGESAAEEWEESKEGHIVLRIRREKGKAVFNMKQQRSNELDNIEYETEVKNPEELHQILLVLGYTPQVEVKKTRRKGKFHGYEICLDEVERLGNFVELEKLAEDNADPAEVQEDLFQTLERLSLSRKNQETRGYDTQVFQMEHKK